jgi:hypothetical protein
MFLVLMGGNFFLYRFSTDSLNTYGSTLGITIGSALWATVLLGAMWFRNGWARYVLGTLVCLAILWYSGVILVLRGETVVPMPNATRAVVEGLLCYAVALIPLGASHALRDFLGPRSGGRRS